MNTEAAEAGHNAKEECGTCVGDGEVSHGSCSIPDCEHMDTCPVCNGSGKRPTDVEIAELRNALNNALGDLYVADAELKAARERLGGAHPFDLDQLESINAALFEIVDEVWNYASTALQTAVPRETWPQFFEDIRQRCLPARTGGTGAFREVESATRLLRDLVKNPVVAGMSANRNLRDLFDKASAFIARYEKGPNDA